MIKRFLILFVWIGFLPFCNLVLFLFLPVWLITGKNTLDWIAPYIDFMSGQEVSNVSGWEYGKILLPPPSLRSKIDLVKPGPPAKDEYPETPVDKPQYN